MCLRRRGTNPPQLVVVRRQSGCWLVSAHKYQLGLRADKTMGVGSISPNLAGMQRFGDPSFDLFTLSDEHNELRAVLRELCEKEIAPYAADVDENSRFPEEALKVLNDTGFSAVHVPEGYGGQGADAVAGCIVVEEVARVCASSSLIPGVNKLGTIGLILSGSEELKTTVLPTLASGEAMASYALSEREAGSDPASMRTRARADGDDWLLNGSKCWITNGGRSTWYTVMAVTDPDKGANGISAFVVHRDDEGFTVGPKERKLGIKGSPTT